MIHLKHAKVNYFDYDSYGFRYKMPRIAFVHKVNEILSRLHPRKDYTLHRVTLSSICL